MNEKNGYTMENRNKFSDTFLFNVIPRLFNSFTK